MYTQMLLILNHLQPMNDAFVGLTLNGMMFMKMI